MECKDNATYTLPITEESLISLANEIEKCYNCIDDIQDIIDSNLTKKNMIEKIQQLIDKLLLA